MVRGLPTRVEAPDVGDSENLFDHTRLELHLPKTGHLRIDIVITHAIGDQANATHLRANLHHSTTCTLDLDLDLEILHDRDRVAIGQDVSDRILHDRHSIDRVGRILHLPLVTAHRTHQQVTRFVGELTGALRAGRQQLRRVSREMSPASSSV
jgi:hypothetical protein